MSNLHTKTQRPIPPAWYWPLLIGVVGFFAAIYFGQALRVVEPWDPSDMVIQGRSMAQGYGFQFYDANNERIGPYFNSTGFVIHAPNDSQPYNVFPPGLGLMVAALYKLGGNLDQVYLIAPVFGVLSLLAAAYLGYSLNGAYSSLVTVLLLGTSQTFTNYATSVWSDGPSVGLLLVGVATYYRSFQTRRWPYALMSGLIFGLLILVRYPNFAYVVLILGHAAVFSKGRDRRTLIGWMLPGILVGSGGLLVYQWVSFGGPFTNAYQAWGKSFWDSGPLFSLSYLLVKTPAPWSDYPLNVIVGTIWGDMGLWSLVCLVGVIANRHSSLKLILALILVVTIGIYGTSMFTTRRLPTERYLLPALAAAYLLAADALSQMWHKINWPALRLGATVAILAVCLASFARQLSPLHDRYAGITQYVTNVKELSLSLPSDSVVLGYGASSTLILYGNISALNYRRIEAIDTEERIGKVVQAVQRMLSLGYPVYLIKDDEAWFNQIYAPLDRAFKVKAVPASLPFFQITPSSTGSSANHQVQFNLR